MIKQNGGKKKEDGVVRGMGEGREYSDRVNRENVMRAQLQTRGVVC